MLTQWRKERVGYQAYTPRSELLGAVIDLTHMDDVECWMWCVAFWPQDANRPVVNITGGEAPTEQEAKDQAGEVMGLLSAAIMLPL